MGLKDFVSELRDKLLNNKPTYNVTPIVAPVTIATSISTSGASWSEPPTIIKPIVKKKLPPLVKPFTTSLDYLDPKMSKWFPDFIKDVTKVNIPIFITCTARLIKCQSALYAQGRLPYEEVNRLRLACGMVKITPDEAGRGVTWTLYSRHLVDFDDTNVDNDYSQAFDFAIGTSKKLYWDVKVNLNKNNIADYEEVGSIAEKYDWVWGGRWKKPDYPHVEMGK